MKRIKHLATRAGAVLLSALLLVGGTGCQTTSDGAEQQGKQEEIKPSRVTYNDNPQSYDDYYNNSVAESLVNLGNTYRIKKVLEKARAGEDITIAYIGGSIMHGDDEFCFANVSYLDFANTYCPGGTEQCHYVNAGLGATGTEVGYARYYDDVESKNPDLVVIGFACNNGNGLESETTYESMLRQCLNAESKPAVILVLGAFLTWTAQYWMRDYGTYYNLPVVSYADGYNYMFVRGQADWPDYTFDNIHPNTEGHAIVADYIKYYLEEADRLPGDTEDLVLPEPLSEVIAEGTRMLNSENITPAENGAWTAGTSSPETKGWSKAEGSSNEPLVLTFRSQLAYFCGINRTTISQGKALVKTYFNGTLVSEKEIDVGSKNAFDGGFVLEYLYRSTVPGEFRIEISATEDNPAAALSIRGIAYHYMPDAAAE